MADSRIQDLIPAEKVLPQDHFVLEQNGEAKNLSGQILVRDLLRALDGHGGIKSWEKTGTEGLIDTYTVTLADGTQTTYTVTNGESGVHYGPDEPSPTQDVWVVTDEQQSDEAFAELDARYAKNNTAVLTNPQELSSEQKAQARTNIDVRSNAENDQRYAPALTRTVSGEVIAVDDVSPLEHEVKCTVSGVPDLSKVTVSRYGGNLAARTQSSLSPDDRSAVNYFPFKSGGRCSFSADVKLNPADDATNPIFSLQANYSDGTSTYQRFPQNKDGQWHHFDATIDVISTKQIKNIVARAADYDTANERSGEVKNIMLNIGDILPFEPTVKQDYNPTIDGTVSGMTSLSPNMTVLTDTPGALLDVTYNADPITIIDKLTQRVADLESAQAQI